MVVRNVTRYEETLVLVLKHCNGCEERYLEKKGCFEIVTVVISVIYELLPQLCWNFGK